MAKKSFFENAGKNMDSLVDTVGKKVGELSESTGETLGQLKEKSGDLKSKFDESTKKIILEVKEKSGTTFNELSENTIKNIGESTDNFKVNGILNKKMRKQAVDDYNGAVERYESVAVTVEAKSQELYTLRQKSVQVIEAVETYINTLANSPKEFAKDLKRIQIELLKFENKQAEILKAEKEAKIASGGMGAGTTLSALGVAVATMGPSAAMGVATTFGVASTGTAISTLSGAAATNAAVAWLGGGALAAGGGGMTAGTALLALAGPVGWGIASVMLTASVGSGIFANSKNKEAATQAIEERKNLEKVIRKFEYMDTKVSLLIDSTNTQCEGIIEIKNYINGTNYSDFTQDEKMKAGLLVNSTLILAELMNKEVALDEQTAEDR